jgi:methionine sulfoxide reductase heme-binding subunit
MAGRLARALGRLLDTVAGWRLFKPAVFIACAVPLAWLLYGLWLALSGRDPRALGPNPTSHLLHETGQTALTLLLVTLSVTPLRRLTGANRLQRVRRMLGVWSFAYAAAHLSVYLTFDRLCYSVATCQWALVWEDLLKRPFIFVGQFGFAILLLLAITSTSGWVRRLKKNWARLHRLVYVAAAAGIVHFIWIQKSGILRPLPWIVAFVVLVLVRLALAILARRRTSGPPVTA